MGKSRGRRAVDIFSGVHLMWMCHAAETMACLCVHRADGSTVLDVYLHVRRDVMHIPGDTDVVDQVHCACCAESDRIGLRRTRCFLCRGFAQAFGVAGTAAGERGKTEEHVSFLLFVASRYQGRPYSWPDARELAEREYPLWRTIVIAKEE
jgi:hypothetical protein